MPPGVEITRGCNPRLRRPATAPPGSPGAHGGTRTRPARIRAEPAHPVHRARKCRHFHPPSSPPRCLAGPGLHPPGTPDIPLPTNGPGPIHRAHQARSCAAGLADHKWNSWPYPRCSPVSRRFRVRQTPGKHLLRIFASPRQAQACLSTAIPETAAPVRPGHRHAPATERCRDSRSAASISGNCSLANCAYSAFSRSRVA